MLDSLHHSVRIYSIIKEQLAHEHNLMPDDQCLIDTIEGMTDLNEQIAALVRDAMHTNAMAAALKIIIEDNSARKQRLEAKAERLRALALWAMTEANIPKIEAPDATISVAPGRPSVKIEDNDLVPDALCRITRKPDLIAIGEKLKSGEFVPYARFSNVVPILKVRTK